MPKSIRICINQSERIIIIIITTTTVIIMIIIIIIITSRLHPALNSSFSLTILSNPVSDDRKRTVIACWLERRTRDRKVASSNPGRTRLVREHSVTVVSAR